ILLYFHTFVNTVVMLLFQLSHIHPLGLLWVSWQRKSKGIVPQQQERPIECIHRTFLLSHRRGTRFLVESMHCNRSRAFPKREFFASGVPPIFLFTSSRAFTASL